MSETRIIRLKSDKIGLLYDVTGWAPLTRDVLWALVNGEVWLAHVCDLRLKRSTPTAPRWIWRPCGRHTVVSLDPLHLEPSIGWTDCCGRHGFIRGGKWEPSGDGGWMAT